MRVQKEAKVSSCLASSFFLTFFVAHAARARGKQSTLSQERVLTGLGIQSFRHALKQVAVLEDEVEGGLAQLTDLGKLKM